jgi:hypothetical protein
MEAKEIVSLAFLIFTLLGLVNAAVSVLNVDLGNINQSAQQAADQIKDLVVPWWVGLVTWLASLGTIGAILIIFLVWFLKWSGEILQHRAKTSSTFLSFSFLKLAYTSGC